MSFTTKEKIREVLTYCEIYGDNKAMEHFDINSESLARYRRKAKEIGVAVSIDLDSDFKKIKDRYTPEEIKAIATGGNKPQATDLSGLVKFSGNKITIGAMTDTHLGSKFTDPKHVLSAFAAFKSANVDFITVSGDITEGFLDRRGHVLELSHIGFDEQKRHAIEIFDQSPAPTYMIDGNHDRWYLKQNNAIIVKDICDALSHCTFLGHDFGEIELGKKTNGDKIRLMLWHGEDGNSYATSYRLQKLVESLTGGNKPHVLFAGHTHKTGFFFPRFVNTFTLGCIQQQTPWMRGKRISAETGFWIVTIHVDDRGVSRVGGEWYPFYE